jgi:hypothetical protein
MDPATAVGSILAAFGLSGAAGLNAFVPLLATALLNRLDVIELAAPYDTLSSTTGLVVLGVLTVADLVGDKIPGVDHVLHVAGTVVAPAAGAVLFAGQSGAESDLPAVVAIVLGALTAGTLHAGRASLRPVSTAGTGGIGNPVLSTVEDVASAGLTAFALVVPLLAVLALAGLLVAVWLAWRRVRARRRPA